jgi:FHS family Na+ dependent glucose MFS transporter 1
MMFPISIKSLRIIGYSGAFVVLGASMASLGPSLPYLAENLQFTVTSLGYLFSTRSLGYLLGSLFVGRLFDRFSGHRLMAVMLLLAAFGMVVIPLAQYVYLLALMLFVVGVGLGVTDVGANTLTAWTYGRRSGAYINTLFFFGGVGSIISPLIVSYILNSGLDIRWAYWVIALMILPPILWLVRLPSPLPSREDKNHDDSRMNYPLLAIFGVLFFLYIGLEVSYGGWIFTFITEGDLGSVSQASLVTSAFYFAITFGRLIAIPVNVRYQQTAIVSACLVGALISLGAILYWHASLLALGVGTLGLGLSIASIFPSTFAFAGKTMCLSGKITGLFWACGSAGAIFTPWFLGQLIGRINPVAMLVTLFIYICMALIVFVGLIQYTKRHPRLSEN